MKRGGKVQLKKIFESTETHAPSTPTVLWMSKKKSKEGKGKLFFGMVSRAL